MSASMHRRAALLIAAVSLVFAAQVTAAPPQREQIGSSLGTPVYRDQLTGTTDAERSDAARGLLITPALREYFQAHRADLLPSDPEIAEVVARMEAARACEPEYMKKDPMTSETRAFVARFLLAGRSTLRHVHQRFGGGRLLFQQGGVEAFDATRRLIEHLEAQGRIRFDDPSIRALAYDYWTRDHGAWLITDATKIQEALEAPVVSACPRPALGDDAG